MKFFTQTMRVLVAAMLLMGFSGLYGQAIQIGTGTSTVTTSPINSCYGYNYSQQIYLASEITTGGGIAGSVTKIAFYYGSSGTTIANWNNWTVYMGNTTKTAFTSTTDWVALANLTQVYSGTIAPVAGNWFELTLSTPFAWDGTSNLVIAVDENAASYSCTATFRSFAAGAARSILYRSDSTNPDPATPPTAYSTYTSIAQVQITGLLPVCTGTPTAGTAAGPAGACSGASFSLSLTGATSGSGIGMQWQSSADGVTWADISGATSATYAATQTAATYYQCVVSCSYSGSSATSNAVLVEMNPFSSCYCSGVISSTSDEEIFNFTLGSLNNTSDCSTVAPGAGSVLMRYSNFTGVTGPSVFQNATYSGSVTIGDCNGGTYYQSGFKVYIDYNQNGVFTDAGEEAYAYLYPSTTVPATWTQAFSITIPGDAMVGTTGMRVVNLETGDLTSIVPCITGTTYGEVEDYLITIATQPQCEGTPTAGTASGPTELCALATASLSLTGYSVDAGISLQWQRSDDGSTFYNVGTDDDTYTSDPLEESAWFQCVVTCANSGASSTSNVVAVAVVPNPNGGTATGPSSGSTGVSYDYETAGSSGSLQWQSSTTSGGTFTNISGATTSTTAISFAGAGSFYLRVKASVLGCTDAYSNEVNTVITVANDNICNATDIPVDGMAHGPYTNAGASTESGETAPPTTNCAGPLSWCSSQVVSHSVWFTFTAPASGRVNIQTTAGSMDDAQLALYDAPAGCEGILAGEGTLLAAVDDANSNGSINMPQFIAHCLTPGTTYYLQVDGYGATEQGTFSMTITDAPLTASISGLSATCSVGAEQALTGTPSGGTFSGTGIVGSAFFPTEAGAGTHTITYTLAAPDGCISTTQDVVVSEPTNYYTDADTDTYGAASGTATQGCSAPMGMVTDNTDCNDEEAGINPGAAEVCDGIDQDCDGNADDGLTFADYYTDADADTYGTGAATNACAQPSGTATVGGDCNDEDAAINPGAAETCDGIDQDCDGNADNGLTFTDYYADGDNDNFGAGAATNACAQPSGSVADNTDCDDANVDINPNASEVNCNGIDDNCDGTIDEGNNLTSLVQLVQLSCSAAAGNSVIILTPSGGESPYTYLWENGATTNFRTGLGAGIFSATVTDVNNCTWSNSWTLAAPDPLDVSFTYVTPKCPGAANGKITPIVTGGSGARSYAWSNGANTPVITNVAAGTYTVTVTDLNGGCTMVGTAVLADAAPIVINSITSVPVGNKYTVTVSASGGTGALQYRRTGPLGGYQAYNSTGIFPNVTATYYVFQVRDANKCIVTQGQSIPVTAPKIANNNPNAVFSGDLTADAIQVSPNPASQLVNVTFPNLTFEGTMNVTDAFGRVLVQQALNLDKGQQAKIDLTQFANGTYCVVLRPTNGQPVSKWFVVAK